ncbi:hypothetical protein HOY34_01395 [Xinfangfangia sp. D13-10-4-6]|uniref:hypothetical protein n=1 Tax=Pseudogemmobacter hezensis TaxID=2737662 RepID=UPI00155379A3|nr:hypothetical protein [Pseudogemmobacter hezensis]NPD13852.1 hypothetical protein [Pseudogemmobacter hezensis]
MILALAGLALALMGFGAGWLLGRRAASTIMTVVICGAGALLAFWLAGELVEHLARQGASQVMGARVARPGEALVIVPSKIAVGTYTVLTLPLRVFFFGLLAAALWLAGVFLGMLADRRKGADGGARI